MADEKSNSQIEELRSDPGFNRNDPAARSKMDSLYQQQYGFAKVGNSNLGDNDMPPGALSQPERNMSSDLSPEEIAQIKSWAKKKPDLRGPEANEADLRGPETNKLEADSIDTNIAPDGNVAPSENEIQEAEREMEVDILNRSGQSGIENLQSLQDEEIGIPQLQGENGLRDFAKRNNLSLREQVDFATMASSIPSWAESEFASPEETVDAVQKMLRGVWGNRYDAELGIAREIAKDLFGSLEKCESWLGSRNITVNARAQVQTMLLFNRLGRCVLQKKGKKK
jgi:hypothetical protein